MPGLGGVQVHLAVSKAGEQWLAGHQSLLQSALVRWETKRFGGPKSRELGELALKWPRGVKGAQSTQEEADDGFGGRFDIVCAGGKFVIEVVTGESKGHEAIHVQKQSQRRCRFTAFAGTTRFGSAFGGTCGIRRPRRAIPCAS